MNQVLILALSVLVCVPACCKQKQTAKTESQKTVTQPEQGTPEATTKTSAKF
jgi:hypothetical protein